MLVPIGDMEAAAASLAEPLGVALDLIKTAEIEPGNSVLVIGPGPIGLMAVSLAQLYGAGRVLLAGIKGDCKRMEIGRTMGADELIYSDEPGWAKTLEGGIDRVLLTAAPALVGETVQCMSFAGIMAYLGIAYGDGSRILLDGNEFHFKRLQLRASFAVPALFFPRALDLLRRGSIRSDLLISHKFPLTEIAAAFDLLRYNRGEALKIVVEMEGNNPA